MSRFFFVFIVTLGKAQGCVGETQGGGETQGRVEMLRVPTVGDDSPASRLRRTGLRHCFFDGGG